MRHAGKGMLLLAMLLVLVGCSQASADRMNKPSYVLKLGIAQNEDNSEYQALLQFKQSVEERTNKDIVIETYPSGQLASVPDLVEQASIGANVGTISDAAMIGDMKREFYMLQSPYLFQDEEEIQKLLDSTLFKGWVEDFSDQGLRILTFNYFLGERNLATVRPILSADDVRGNVIRTNGSQIVNYAVAAMGASPSGMPWAEAYPGLQQGVIDGVEAHNSAIYESSLYEVINHIARTNHYSLVSSLVVSERWFDQLPEEYKEIIVEEAIRSGEYASMIAAEQSATYEEAMIEAGVQFHDIDVEPLRERTEVIFSRLGLDEIVENVQAVLAE